MSKRLTAEDVIKWLGLEPLPHEGGFFRQTWTSDQFTDLPQDIVVMTDPDWAEQPSTF